MLSSSLRHSIGQALHLRRCVHQQTRIKLLRNSSQHAWQDERPQEPVPVRSPWTDPYQPSPSSQQLPALNGGSNVEHTFPKRLRPDNFGSLPQASQSSDLGEVGQQISPEQMLRQPQSYGVQQGAQPHTSNPLGDLQGRPRRSLKPRPTQHSETHSDFIRVEREEQHTGQQRAVNRPQINPVSTRKTAGFADKYAKKGREISSPSLFPNAAALLGRHDRRAVEGAPELGFARTVQQVQHPRQRQPQPSHQPRTPWVNMEAYFPSSSTALPRTIEEGALPQRGSASSELRELESQQLEVQDGQRLTDVASGLGRAGSQTRGIERSRGSDGGHESSELSQRYKLGQRPEKRSSGAAQQQWSQRTRLGDPDRSEQAASAGELHIGNEQQLRQGRLSRKQERPIRSDGTNPGNTRPISARPLSKPRQAAGPTQTSSEQDIPKPRLISPTSPTSYSTASAAGYAQRRRPAHREAGVANLGTRLEDMARALETGESRKVQSCRSESSHVQQHALPLTSRERPTGPARSLSSDLLANILSPAARSLELGTPPRERWSTAAAQSPLLPPPPLHTHQGRTGKSYGDPCRGATLSEPSPTSSLPSRAVSPQQRWHSPPSQSMSPNPLPLQKQGGLNPPMPSHPLEQEPEVSHKSPEPAQGGKSPANRLELILLSLKRSEDPLVTQDLQHQHRRSASDLARPASRSRSFGEQLFRRTSARTQRGRTNPQQSVLEGPVEQRDIISQEAMGRQSGSRGAPQGLLERKMRMQPQFWQQEVQNAEHRRQRSMANMSRSSIPRPSLASPQQRWMEEIEALSQKQRLQDEPERLRKRSPGSATWSDATVVKEMPASRPKPKHRQAVPRFEIFPDLRLEQEAAKKFGQFEYEDRRRQKEGRAAPVRMSRWEEKEGGWARPSAQEVQRREQRRIERQDRLWKHRQPRTSNWLTTEGEYDEPQAEEDVANQAEQRQKRQAPGPREIKSQALILPHEPLRISKLASMLAMKVSAVIGKLEKIGAGEGLEANTLVDLDYAELLGLEFGREVKRMAPKDELAEEQARYRTKQLDWPLRPPVVCVMGHVDHGKTTLLDALRKSKVAQGEAGGITQRLGAFHIHALFGSYNKALRGSPASDEASSESLTPSDLLGKPPSMSLPSGVTILDTPGHAAFSKMRLHGANATDIVLLVVSATDGLKTQTREVLEMVRQEDLALVVAVTKTDMLGSPEEVTDIIDNIADQLLECGIRTEARGGDVQMVPVSAVSGQGLQDLIERLMLQAEVLELRADHNAPGDGIVLDSYIEKGFGQVADVLMRWGCLRVGDYVVAGDQCTRIRKMMDEHGQSLEQGLPSMPMRLLGFTQLPSPGSGLIVVKDEERAKAVVEGRKAAAARNRLNIAKELNVVREEDVAQMQEASELAKRRRSVKTKAYLSMQRDPLLNDNNKEKHIDGPIVVPFVVKADGQGALEAITSLISSYTGDIIRAEIVHAGCGPISQADLDVASDVTGGRMKGCTIAGYNVGFANQGVEDELRKAGIGVKRGRVIYEVVDALKGVLQANMPDERQETALGRLEVQAVFNLTGKRRTKEQVAGCKVTFGQALSAGACKYRVLRANAVLCEESPCASLYHFKDQVPEVKKGQECGLSLERFGAYEKGDVIEAYNVAYKPKSLASVFPW